MPDERPYLEDVTVFVSTIGDEVNFADCMEHLHRQTVRFALDVIDHVAPMSAAFQEMQDRCRSEFYIQVDEDMILAPHAVADLRAWISSARKNVAMVCAPLWDCDAELAIYGVKIYRTDVVKRFPYRNAVGCEVDQMARLQAAGFDVDLRPLLGREACLGEHGKHYTPQTIFKRWQRCFQKHGEYGNMAWIEPYARRLLDRYAASGQTLHLYAFLGAMAGVVGPAPPDRELDWREANVALERVQHYFPADR